MEKDHLSIKRVVKNLSKIKTQKLKLWTQVLIAASSCPAAAHMYR